MARQLANLRLYLNGDPEKKPAPSDGYIVYDVVDGKAKREFEHHKLEGLADKLAKPFHETGEVGEFWRDEIDLIKMKEDVL